MAAAVPIIGSIITGFLVSKAISTIGPQLGLSEEITGIAATVGGMYAGGMTYSSANAASATAGNQVGMDLSLPTQGADLSMAGSNAAPSGGDLSIAGSSMAPSGPGAQNTGLNLSMAGGNTAPSATTAQPSPGNPHLDSPLKISSAPEPAQPGILSQSSPSAEAPASSTAKTEIAAGTTGTAPKTDGEQSWFDKLFSSEKTMDLLVAGMQGYANAGMAKDDREYPERIHQKRAAGWAAANPDPSGGFLSISQQFPSRQ